MKIIIFKPSVDREEFYKAKELEKCFETMKLIDKTICGDRIIYIFKEDIKEDIIETTRDLEALEEIFRARSTSPIVDKED